MIVMIAVIGILNDPNSVRVGENVSNVYADCIALTANIPSAIYFVAVNKI